MVVSANLHSVSALKALTYRLASTPTTHLPRYVAQLSASIWMCRDILSASADTLKRGGAVGTDTSDLTVIVHRFRTQLSSLLQDRTVEGRWAAVVLTKVTIEAGGLEVLSKSNAWVRNLLAILKRPDPPSTRAFAILVLTRIFMLTWDHVSLVREITTPALPAFVATCLSNAVNKQCSNNELLNILEAFELLLPHHPTIFRTNEAVLRSLLLRIIASSDQDNDSFYTTEHIHTAQRLLPALPFVLPKQGGSEKWAENLQTTINDANSTCDLVFFPIIEAGGRSSKTRLTTIASAEYDKSGLPPWSGLHAGVDRLVVLLQSISAHLQTATQLPVSVGLGSILNLLDRIFAALPPGSDKHKLVKPNPEAPKEQRDILTVSLPAIHAAAFALLTSLIDHLGLASTSVLSSCFEHTMDVFVAENFDVNLRTAAYKLAVQIVNLQGLSMSKSQIQQLTPLLQRACHDLLSEATPDTKKTELLPTTAIRSLQASVKSHATPNAITPSTDSKHYPELQNQASAILVAALSKLDARHMPRSLRTQIDRTAVLTQNKCALLASVLNPAPAPSGNALQTSLLPLLARLFPDEPEIEALIRPRMSVIRNGQTDVMDVEQELESENEGLIDTATAPGQILNPDETGDDLDDAPDGAAAQPLLHEQDQAAAFDTFVGTMQQKRPLPPDAEETIESKKARSTAPGLNNNDDETTRATPPVKRSASSMAQSAQPDALSEAGDDSDIELPELTLEQDTEDEDE